MDQETRKEFKKLNDKFDKKFDILSDAIKENQKSIKENQRSIQKLGVDFEDFRHKQELSLELLESIKEQMEKPLTKKEVNKKLENHENRISALEHTVKEI